MPEGRSLRWAPYGDLYEGIEFLNVYASGMFNDAGASPIDDLGRIGARGWSNQERYRGWVYQDAAGEWTYMPLNHIVSSPSFARRVCLDSRWILVGEADRAPTVELLEDTWRHAHVGICHYIYDTHFNYLPEANPLPGGTVLRAHYRLSNTPRAEAEALWRQAKALPVPEDERRATDFPVCTWCGLDTFTEGVHHGCYDPHRFWQPFVRGPHPAVRPWHDPAIRHNHEAMQRYRFPQSEAIRFGWNPVCPDRRGGSVWVENEVPAASGWGLFFNGAVPYLAERPYRLSAWVRGTDVRGTGIALSVKPGNQQEAVWTPRIQSAAEWQRLELELPPLKANLVSGPAPPGLVFESNRLDIRFELDGIGRAEMAEIRYGSVR
ncbi:MAG: hypothetical protein BWZ02_03235 [Lentisphaerae bacterium ADurb.BinA184]|nr:MAG: hypothetical protein BWZ02_03235 [Lentisphaerae bacterium ADurb.BinA184]